jgi:hypothetical protein
MYGSSTEGWALPVRRCFPPMVFVWICEAFVRREYFAVTKTLRNGFQLDIERLQNFVS